VLRPAIERGVPVVGLEPSCVSVLRDEMTGLLPRDPDAQRLKQQTHLFSEFVVAQARPEDLPRLAQVERSAVVHGHCHEKALFGMDGEAELLRRLGVDATVLDTGCCGMAGSFGFEAGEKYRVSMAIGELDVLPKVRQAATDALVIADGFSCREQIQGSTTRRALHVAEVARMALPDAARDAGRRVPPARLAARRPAALAVLALGGLGALAAPRRGRRRFGGMPLRRSLSALFAIVGGLALAVTGLAARQPEGDRR
jgi:hypothetical protein